MGSIGCSGLGVAGGEGDSVIRITQNQILQSVNFNTSDNITQTISESVTVNVT